MFKVNNKDTRTVVCNRAIQDTFFKSQGNKNQSFLCTLFWDYFLFSWDSKKSTIGSIVTWYYLNQ